MKDSRGVELAPEQTVIWAGGYNHGRYPRVGKVLQVNENTHLVTCKADRKYRWQSSTGIANVNPAHVTVINGLPEVTKSD